MLLHEFSPEIARHYGINAAIVYQYLRWRTGAKRSVRISTRQLAEQYSYLGHKAIRNALDVLRKGTRRHPALIKRSLNALTDVAQYTVDANFDTEDRSLYRFSAAKAGQLGVLPAILYHNLRHWVVANWKEGAVEVAGKLNLDDFNLDGDKLYEKAYKLAQGRAWHYVTPKAWHRQHPYVSLSAVERAFRLLESENLIRKRPNRQRKPYWTLNAKIMDKIRYKLCEPSSLEIPTVKRAQLPSKGHSYRQKGTVHRQKGTAKTHDLTGPLTENSDFLPVKSIIISRVGETLVKEADTRTSLRDASRQVSVKPLVPKKPRMDRPKPAQNAFNDPAKRSYQVYDPEDWGEFEDWRVQRWEAEYRQLQDL